MVNVSLKWFSSEECMKKKKEGLSEWATAQFKCVINGLDPPAHGVSQTLFSRLWVTMPACFRPISCSVYQSWGHIYSQHKGLLSLPRLPHSPSLAHHQQQQCMRNPVDVGSCSVAEPSLSDVHVVLAAIAVCLDSTSRFCIVSCDCQRVVFTGGSSSGGKSSCLATGRLLVQYPGSSSS